MHCIKISDITTKQRDLKSQITNILSQHICTFEGIKSRLKGDFTDPMIYQTLHRIAEKYTPDPSLHTELHNYKKKKFFGYETTTGEFFVKTHYKNYYHLKEADMSENWIKEPEIEIEKIEEPLESDFLSLKRTQPLLYIYKNKVIEKHYKDRYPHEKEIGVVL